MSRVRVTSPSVGTVVEVSRVAGAPVASGDEVVVIESMKMEIPVLAPCAGSVADVRVAAGDHVETGDVLLIIDPG